jgi:hypothetical protein
MIYCGEVQQIQVWQLWVQSAESRWVVLAVQASAESAERHILFARINSLDPGDQMLSQKRLIDAGIDTFPSKNWLSTA